MIGRSLTRRLEHLETHLLPAAGKRTVITVDYVDANGTVVDHKDFTVKAPPPNETQPARATMVAMKNLARRLARLGRSSSRLSHFPNRDGLTDPVWAGLAVGLPQTNRNSVDSCFGKRDQCVEAKGHKPQ
jgi:hypothetical protein